MLIKELLYLIKERKKKGVTKYMLKTWIDTFIFSFLFFIFFITRVQVNPMARP